MVLEAVLSWSPRGLEDRVASSEFRPSAEWLPSDDDVQGVEVSRTPRLWCRLLWSRGR